MQLFVALVATGFILRDNTATSQIAPSVLNSVLRHHELLHPSQLRHSVVTQKTSIHSTAVVARQVHFYSLGRSFSLHLTPGMSALSHSFEILTEDGHGQRERLLVDTNQFMEGHVIGEEGSVVLGHLSEHGTLTAHIRTQADHFYIEPLSWHSNSSHDHHMIMYNKKHVINSLPSLSVDFESVPLMASIQSVTGMVHDDHRMLRRQALDSEQDTCHMVMVADYRFYEFLQSSESSVVQWMVGLVAAIDSDIFRPTNWVTDAEGASISEFGLQIDMVIIHTEPTESGADHYNSVAAGELDISSLLSSFSVEDWSQYCLAHLVTQRRFASGKLGLAYIASPSLDEAGGICSFRVFSLASNQEMSYNTVLSVASVGERLLLQEEAVLIAAHELGHSWGSHHDPADEPDCRSDYLMYEFAQDGSQESHMQFSPCSTRSIGRVLANKAVCFTARSSSLCGNYQLDEGEQCDGGRTTLDGRDPCCTEECQLKDGSVCSDINHSCCQGCSIAGPQSIKCHSVGQFSVDCTTDTYCDGSSINCPSPLPAADGDECLGGRCVVDPDTGSVSCVPHCQLQGLDDCQCSNESSCLVCCLNSSSVGAAAQCQPLLKDGATIFVADGISCVNGLCYQGVCEDDVKDFISQLWSIISTFDVNSFSQFLVDNVVGCVLFVSLLLWIPGSCLFHYLWDVKKLWRLCLKVQKKDHSDTLDSMFTSQSSWENLAELAPLLSVEGDDDEYAGYVDEPVDMEPLPPGIRDGTSGWQTI